VLQMQIGSGFQTSGCRFSSLARNPVQRWLPALALTLLGGFGAATDVRAQAPPAGSASEPTATAQPAATSVTPGVRPTIRLEGNHIVFSSTSEAARTALETVKKKGWKPGPDVVQALSHAPPEPIFLAVGDPRETVPSLLASLPGTLQAQINSAIALSAGGSPGARPGESGPPGAPAPNTSAAAGVPPDAMIQLRVDAAKLPKAEELKALMFTGTLAVVVDDTSIRLVSRESFPDVVSGMGLGAIGGALLAPAVQVARARALAAAGVPPGQAAPAPAPGNSPAAAQPPAARAGPARMGGARGPGRGGRPGGGGRPG